MRSMTRREMVWIGLLCVVAVMVWMMKEDDTGVTGLGQRLSVSQAVRVVNRFRHVGRLSDVVAVSESAGSDRMRNIFRFGSAAPKVFADTGSPEIKPVSDEAKLSDTGHVKDESTVQGSEGPPPVDFNVEGIIMGQGRKAAVITREPELFVVPEGAVFLERYILKEVSRQGLRIGFTGFDDTVFLPVEKNRGN